MTDDTPAPGDTPPGDRIPPMPPDGPQGGVRTAEVEKSRWFGWIWLVPIAALAVVAYLGYSAFANSGPSVTLVFEGAPGIKAGGTKVRYQGQEVGEVEAVKLERDLKHTDATLSLHPSLAGQLGPGTRFWLEGGRLSLNDLGDLQTLLSGPVIGIDPKPGDKQERYVVLPEKPVLAEEQIGRHFFLHAAELGTVSRGSDVVNQGMQVGKVVDVHMSPDGHGIDIQAFVDARYTKLVHEGTRFWNAGAVQVSTAGAGPRVQFQSLPALFSGAIAFDTPPAASERPEAPDGTHFPLYPGQSEAEGAPSRQALPYAVVFDDPASSLPRYAAVTLGGKRIGSVADSAMRYDAGTQKLRLLATLMLEPAEMKIDNGTGDARAQMDAMLRALIGQGLRAGMQASPPLIGGQEVALRFVQGAAPAQLGEGPAPTIPATEGGGLDGIMAQAGDVLAKVNAMKLDQIADNLRKTTDRLAALSTSPQMTAGLRNVSEALANLRDVSGSLKREAGPALADLREAAGSARSLVGQANEVSGAPDTATLPTTLYEVRRAARSIRELANTLDRHPEALVVGK